MNTEKIVLQQHNIGKIYADYLDSENEKNRQERYVDKEHFYHASGAGTCTRKLYFQSVEKVEPTNPSNTASMRVMRLGTVLHKDIQDSLILYNNTNNNNNINNNITNTSITNKYKLLSKNRFEVEGEVSIEELNVRGFFDILQVKNESTDDVGVFLYDIKTSADYSFKLLFGSKQHKRMEPHELQTATYGYAIRQKYGRLDGMYILYYNKNTSVIKYKQLPLSMVSTAYMFWANVNKLHSVGLPRIEDGVSPVMKWECNYCNFYDHCNPPKGYGKDNHKYTTRRTK